jgi:hypothetical protein
VPILLFGASAIERPERIEHIGVSANKVYHVTHVVDVAVMKHPDRGTIAS